MVLRPFFSMEGIARTAIFQLDGYRTIKHKCVKMRTFAMLLIQTCMLCLLGFWLYFIDFNFYLLACLL